MSEIRISILKGEFAFPSFLKDAEMLNKIPSDKLPDFIQWVLNHEIFSESLTEGDANEAAKNFDISTTDLLSAVRITDFYFTRGVRVSEAELLSDFDKLGFEKAKAQLIIKILKDA